MKTFAIRLHKGDDLKRHLDQLATTNQWPAACILSCVGSLTRASIRYANRPEPTGLEGHFEILSLNGTLSKDGSHLHICISDENGATIGGHLKEGSEVFMTAEIVVSILEGYAFEREIDPKTGHLELKIRKTDNF